MIRELLRKDLLKKGGEAREVRETDSRDAVEDCKNRAVCRKSSN